MRAAVLEKFDAALVEQDVDISDVGSDEVLVRVVASGICHSDRSAHVGADTTGERSDTIMIIHIDRSLTKGTVISIPRGSRGIRRWAPSSAADDGG